MARGLSNEDVVRRFYEGWNSADINFAELVAEDIVNHQPEAEPNAVEAIRRRDRAGHGRRPGLAVDDLRRLGRRRPCCGEDHLVRYVRSAAVRGLPIAAPGTFSAEHIHIYRVADGKLAEHWVVRDDLTMLRQLGAVPS